MASEPNDTHRSLLDLTLRNASFMRAAPLCIGALFNFVLAVFNGVMGLLQSSHWSTMMAAYFLVLCIMGSYVAACTVRPERHPAHHVMRVCGVWIIVLAIAVVIFKCLSIGEGHNDANHPYLMILFAAFTFATAAIAIVDATKARKGGDYQQAFLRISIASMLGAMMITEMQMLGTFADLTDASTTAAIETASGAVVVLLLLLMGISLVRKSKRSAGD